MSRHVLPDHNAGHGLHLPPPRTLMILGAAGALVLMLVLRGRTAAAAPAATDPTVQDAGTAGVPSTFADNGGQAAQLGDNVTSGLGGVSDALGSFTDQLNTFGAGVQGQLDTLSGQVADAAAANKPPTLAQEIGDVTSAVAAVNKLTKAAGAPAGKAKPKAKTSTKTTHKTTTHKKAKAHHGSVAVSKPVHHHSPAKKPHTTHH